VFEKASEYTVPADGKFYTIECPLFENTQGVKKGLFVNAEGALAWGTVDLTSKNYYWIPTVNTENKTWFLKNAGTGFYLSGTAVADAGGLGNIEIEAMREVGYDDDFSCAVTCASSVLGPIIPPSLPMVILAVTVGASVGRCFVGGIIPGVLIAVALCTMVAYYAKKRKYPKNPRPTMKMVWVAFKEAFFALLAPVILFAAIYTGVVTTTEAAIVAAFYSLLIGLFIYKDLKWKDIPGIMRQTCETTGVVLAIVLFVRRVMQTSSISVLDGHTVAATEDDEKASMENTDRLDIPDGVEVYEIDGPFFFGLASRFEELENMKAAGTKVRIIRMRKVPFIDSTGVNNLRNLCERTRKRGVTVILSGVTEKVQATLVRFGVDKEIGQENIFPHIVPALVKAKELVS
jgi:anti-anti-sigma factor